MVRVHVGPKWCPGRGTRAGRPAGQAEGGDRDPGAHGHAAAGAHLPGLRTGPARGTGAETEASGNGGKLCGNTELLTLHLHGLEPPFLRPTPGLQPWGLHLPEG